MPTSRIAFQELPPAVIAAVEKRTGPILKVEPANEGFNSEVAARVFTETESCFIKGMRADHRRIWTQRREAEVNQFLTGLTPELLWHTEEAGWNLLGFELLEGHHADYSPGSPDLPKVADLLRRLGEIPCPEIELRQAEQRLEGYAASAKDLDFFAGNALLHTDLNNANVLVDDSARLVDWAWATRGAPWLDAGYWVIWLMAAGGHTPDSAEQWASHVPAWSAAPSAGVTAFAVANAAMWQEIGGEDPDPWTARLVTAARNWATYRKSL
ncbi:aminoglycoside phosphotransferase [Streptomyces sp. ST2-7A]|uniref:aminoglycoside phosphotransferase n=1 Tax=Streptomyces sp. ST2-7A TaxID=2907214 RepID=UPI001F1DEB51|nr:aminoglycoside phosphotransferase [Streptomyces sp. ST2-7A]MCE7081353.1 aminoglycoside phosphotransferase [Streptomyces sp. ST2-7A]